MNPNVKTPAQLGKMRAAGLVVWEAHQKAAELVRPGIATQEIDAVVDAHILARGGAPLFKGVPGETGPFPAATCISVNEQVVHGIPGPRRLREGDVVSIDIGVRLDGWCGDAAVTRPVGMVTPQARRLLEVTEGSLRLAIELLAVKRRWSEVAREMAHYVRRAGFSVVEELAGHSVGQEMWDGLHVPNYTNRKYEREFDFALEPGLVLAVEPMVNAGRRHVKTLPDGWTVVTSDRRPSAHFEHTIALTREGPLALTAGPDGSGWAL